MSAENEGPISKENLSTVVAVAAVLAILALAYAVFLGRQIEVVAVGATALDVKAARRDIEMNRKIEALTKRVTELEGQGAVATEEGGSTAGASAATATTGEAPAGANATAPTAEKHP